MSVAKSRLNAEEDEQLTFWGGVMKGREETGQMRAWKLRRKQALGHGGALACLGVSHLGMASSCYHVIYMSQK